MVRDLALIRVGALILLGGVLANAPQEPPRDTLPESLPVRPPRGLERGAYTPPPHTAAQLALGRRLFFDPILSVDRSVACASCHRPDHGFADLRPVSTGVRGQSTLRNAPSLFNRALGEAFMWDGRASNLEQQVLLPVENPLEMDLPLAQAMGRLADDDSYSSAFREAFGRAPDRDGLAAALAAFVRCLWIGDSPVDRFREGEVAALTPGEKAGLWLYESRAGCWRCHVGANFTDEGFHNTGVGVRAGRPEEGRAAITGQAADRGAFKTPTLRGLSHSAPYMHDGSLATLEEVVEFYRRGGNDNPDRDRRMGILDLSDADAVNLVAFLRALSRPADRAPPDRR